MTSANDFSQLRIFDSSFAAGCLFVWSFFPLISCNTLPPAIEQVKAADTKFEVDWDSEPLCAVKRTRRGVKLSLREVRAMVEIWGLPPFLNAEQAAKLYQRSIGVLRNHVSEGRFPRSAIIGKPLLFVTTRFIQEIAARAEGGRR